MQIRTEQGMNAEGMLGLLRRLLTDPLNELYRLEGTTTGQVFRNRWGESVTLLLLHPVFGLLAGLIHSGFSGSIRWDKWFLFPLLINLVVVAIVYLLGGFGRIAGEAVELSQSREKHAQMLIVCLLPFFASGVFRIIPIFGSLMIALSILYGFVLIHFTWKHVYGLAGRKEGIFFLLQSLYLLLTAIALATIIMFLRWIARLLGDFL